jgi:hypothetical protein
MGKNKEKEKSSISNIRLRFHMLANCMIKPNHVTHLQLKP